MASPYFESSNKQIDESKAGLLKAVAEGGSAGKAAFDAAQAQAAQARQEAVGRAAERSALYGVGGDSQTFLGAYDSRVNQMGVNRANFESGLAQTSASGQAYLEKARASIPVLEGINTNKAADVEGKIRTAIEAAKAKAEAERLKEERALQRQLDAEARAEARAVAREGRAESRAAAKDRAKLPKAADLFSAAELAKKQMVGTAQGEFDRLNTPVPAGQFGSVSNAPGGAGKYLYTSGNLRLPISQQVLKEAGALDVADLARQIGLNMGLDEVSVGAILNPAAVNSYRTAVSKLTPPAPVPATVKQLSTSTKIPADKIESAMGDLRYKRSYEKVKQLLAQGLAWDAVDSALRTDLLPNMPTSYAILQQQFRPLFSNAALLKTAEEE